MKLREILSTTISQMLVELIVELYLLIEIFAEVLVGLDETLAVLINVIF